MRTTFIVSAFAALAIAAPRPQDIEFDQVDAAPDAEIVSPPTDVTTDYVAVQPVAEAVAIATAAIFETTTTQKRDFLEVVDSIAKRDGDCSAEPAGTGPQVSIPADTDDAFLNHGPFHTAAVAAASPSGVPQGYSLAFQDLNGSSQTTAYLGYTTLNEYDPIQCASYCDQQAGCMAFNLYFERDPSQAPNATSCPNPSSVTNIKCVIWGVWIQPETATNVGQYQ
ncbi:hypothetical protein LSUE1_G003964, partial [Lachnellula suecica]